MAALSFFSNWGCSSLDHHQVQLKSDSLSFHQQQQQAQSQPQLSANNIEQLVYATNEYSLNNNYLTPLLPNIMCSNPSDYNLLSYSPESYYFANFEDHDYESFWYPKRHKVNENHCPISVDHDTTSSHLFDGCVQNYPHFMPDDQFVPIDAILPEDEADYHQYIAPIVFDNSSYDHQNIKDLNKPNKVLSAQSIAARQRRRKITEKTQELGKLIPGGNKMNTAEMFQAAYKYVKFLQSQVYLLQLMASFQVYIIIYYTFYFFFLSIYMCVYVYIGLY